MCFPVDLVSASDEPSRYASVAFVQREHDHSTIKTILSCIKRTVSLAEALQCVIVVSLPTVLLLLFFYKEYTHTSRGVHFLFYFLLPYALILDLLTAPIPFLQSQLEKLVQKNYFLYKSAVEAYRSYVLAYASHALKDVFNVHELDLKVRSRVQRKQPTPSAQGLTD